MKNQKVFENLLVYIFFGVFLFLGYGALKSPEETEDNILKVHYLDVGQGDATLIETPNKEYILIDGGPDKSVLAELSEIIPAYEKEIDVLILSHPHADHVSGFNYILDRYDVGQIYITGAVHNTPDFIAFLEKIKEHKISTSKLTAGEKINYGEVSIDVIWPDQNRVGEYDLNDGSMIFNLEYGETSFLFTGDASAKVQESIIDRFVFDVDVLKVSHHGSKTGTSQEIINKIIPEYAVISSGEGNYFGHPHPSIFGLLSEQIVFRTDIDGTVTFTSDGKTIQH